MGANQDLQDQVQNVNPAALSAVEGQEHQVTLLQTSRYPKP
jgi:hypothetical protein